MGKYRQHPFNEHLRKHYHYKSNEEEEIRTQIYKNKETNNFTSMITILKSVWYQTKANVETLVIDGNIFLKVTINYFEMVKPEEVNQLLEDLQKQINTKNIKLEIKPVSEEEFENIRVMKL